MTKWVLISLLSASTLALATPVFSQTTQPQTDQTDQSEEDWRRSQRKSGTRDIYRTPNTSSDGFGRSIGEVEPLRKVDTLPRESRRHVMRERAKAIAESEDGMLSEAEFEPSDAAQNDEDLARQEQEAWDELVADSQASTSGGTQSDSADATQTDQAGSSGSSQEGAQGDPQSQDQASAEPRGGSSRSLQEIMNSIKGSPTGSAQSGQTSDAGEQGSSASIAPATQSADAGGSAQSDGAKGDDGDGDQSGASDSASAQQGSDSSRAQGSAELSPLDYLRQRREERDSEDRKRSASDYIHSAPGTDGRFEDETED